ncbi:hypothetical protein LCGC14_0651130 [marine sediment metagenome]|uniref:Uncharacterized protein n=1 Tax=marine sediment metagenome TaxID=412755 RepID=A0A0F9R1I1_9ZZZZ
MINDIRILIIIGCPSLKTSKTGDNILPEKNIIKNNIIRKIKLVPNCHAFFDLIFKNKK